MAKNLKFYFDQSGKPCARGPQTETVLMNFLETDIQGNDHVCHDLLADINAVQSNAVDSREFESSGHVVTIGEETITILRRESTGSNDENTSTTSAPVPATATGTADAASNTKQLTDSNHYQTALKHFKEIIEDWESFILDESAG